VDARHAEPRLTEGDTPPEAKALVIAPARGSAFDHPFLSGFAEAIAALGVSTLRFNFLYKERGRKSPDPEQTLRDVWLAAFEEATARANARPSSSGGKSLGGRIRVHVRCGRDAGGRSRLPRLPRSTRRGSPNASATSTCTGSTRPMLFIQGNARSVSRSRSCSPSAEEARPPSGARFHRGRRPLVPVPGKKRSDADIGAGLAEPAAAFLRDVAV